MKTMKMCCALVGATTLLTANTMFASLGTVTLTDAGGNQNGGGLFKAQTSENGTFLTFCLSIPTTFSPGTQYYYEISPIIKANGSAPTYVSYGVAWLFNQFEQGNANFIGAGNANAVQAAIWYLQGDLGDSLGNNLGVAGNFYDPENHVDLSGLVNGILGQIITATSLSVSALESDGGGAFGVEAMNLYTTDSDQGRIAQPQLYIPVPEPSTIVAGALLLLPFGVSTLRIMRKNKMQ